MTKDEKELKIKRIKIFKSLLPENNKLAFFVEYANSQDWELSKKTISRYLKEAKGIVKKDTKKQKRTVKKDSEKAKKDSEIVSHIAKSDSEPNLKHERIKEFEELLNDGYSKRSDFIEYANNQDWGVSERTVDRYFRAAIDNFQSSMFMKNKSDLKRYSSSLLELMINRSLVKENDKLALEAIKALNDMHKLKEFELFKEQKEKKEVNEHTKTIDEILESLKRL